MIRRASDTALVCMRVADTADVAAGSRQGRCHDCGAAVWVSPASARAVGGDAIILCIPCFNVRATAQDGAIHMANPTDGQLRELQDHFAPDPAEPPPEELP